jgi:hypothetical protein
MKNQTINNAADQVITDYYTGGGDGIKRMAIPSTPNDDLKFIDSFFAYLRTITGASEVMSGEVLGSNMSGAAISALQSQAEKPLDEMRNRFLRAKEKQAQVLLRFYKHYYDKEEIVAKDDEKVTFDSSQLANKKYTCVAEAGNGVAYSGLTRLAVLQEAMKSGQITFREMIVLSDENFFGNKRELLDQIDKREQAEIVQLQMQNKQLQEQMMQAAQVITEQAKVVNDVKTIVADNNTLRSAMAELQSKLIQIMATADTMLKQKDAEKGQILAEASKFAEETLANQQGTKISNGNNPQG